MISPPFRKGGKGDLIDVLRMNTLFLENMLKRCKWVGNDPIYIEYHDKEWGVPVHDDKKSPS